MANKNSYPLTGNFTVYHAEILNNPTTEYGIVNKKYVDAIVHPEKVILDARGENIINLKSAEGLYDAVNKYDVQTMIANRNGDLDMHLYKIRNLETPSDDYDAATKKYVDYARSDCLVRFKANDTPIIIEEMVFEDTVVKKITIHADKEVELEVIIGKYINTYTFMKGLSSVYPNQDIEKGETISIGIPEGKIVGQIFLSNN